MEERLGEIRKKRGGEREPLFLQVLRVLKLELKHQNLVFF